MKPAVYDLTIYCGTTFDAGTLTFTYKVNGVAVNLTTFQARAQARGARNLLLFDLSTANGGLVLGGAAGTITMLLTAAQTTAMWRDDFPNEGNPNGAPLFHAGAWDLELVALDGRVVRLLQGRLLLSPEVTV